MWGDIDPQRTRSYFWGITPLCQIWWKSTKKCDRESDDTRTDRHTHTHADRQTHRQMQTDFIICPIAICYSYATDKNLRHSSRPPSTSARKKISRLVPVLSIFRVLGVFLSLLFPVSQKWATTWKTSADVQIRHKIVQKYSTTNISC